MRKAIGFILALIVFISACDRDDTPYEGPSLVDLYGEFSILEDFDISNRNIDFSAGEQTHFTAQFSKTADWEIHIIGQTSGARKIISGTSNSLDASNSLWRGSTTDLPSFSAEACQVELRIPSDTIVIFDSLLVSSSKPAEGFVIADFENGLNPGWGGFVQSGTNMSFTVVDNLPAGQGQFYYDMGGEVDWDWLIGLIDIPATAYTNGFEQGDNGDEVYFNIFFYKPAGITNEVVLIQFKEDEDQNGVFTESAEDLYAIEFKNLEVGWQQISIKYSDLVNLVNGQAAAPNGNGVHNPDLLNMISILMLAEPSSGYSQVLMDNLVFTEGKPLEP